MFQLTVLDVWFFGLRAIFHTDSDFSLEDRLASIVIVTLSFIEMLDIWFRNMQVVIAGDNQQDGLQILGDSPNKLEISESSMAKIRNDNVSDFEKQKSQIQTQIGIVDKLQSQ